MNDQNIWTLIITWGTIQSFILAPIVVFKSEYKQPQKIVLSLILLLIGFQSFSFLHSYFGWHLKSPHLIWLNSLIWFLIGPLLFLFERFSTVKDYKLKPIHVLHLIPFFLAFIYMWDFFALSGESKIRVLESFYENYSGSPDLFFYTYIIFEFTYGSISYYNFKKYFSDVGKEYSRDSIYNQKWVLNFILLFNIFWAITLIYHLLLLFSFEFFFPYDYVTYIFLTLFIQTFGFASVLNPNSFFVTPIDKENESMLSSAELPDLKITVDELEEYMRNEKPFLNPELRINDLSRMIDIPTHKLSQLINKETDKNFFEFINDFRIKEVKKRLPDPSYSNLTLNAIAKDCGFNSSASFYRVFKQSTGLTPKQFLNTFS